MYEDLAEEVGVFDFDEFANHLVDQGMLVSPSQTAWLPLRSVVCRRADRGRVWS